MMIPIKDLLDKLKWDERFDISEYTIFYHDRVTGKDVAIPCADILRIEDGFFVILRDEGEVRIPLHRIRLVKKGRMNVWRREVTSG
jgi:uncharacterized protein (UPF0248 family)